MITNLKVQRAIVSWMKNRAGIVASLGTTDEIRENEWQGNVFTYPNIRIRMMELVPLLRNECDVTRVTVDILIASNKPSSLEAETIADAVIVQMNHRKFTQNGIQFISMKVVSQEPAYRSESEGIWRSEVHLQVVVS